MSHLSNGIIYIISVITVENVTNKEYKNLDVVPSSYFDNSIDIFHRPLRLSEVILAITMEGTVSQIRYLCLSSNFMIV